MNSREVAILGVDYSLALTAAAIESGYVLGLGDDAGEICGTQLRPGRKKRETLEMSLLDKVRRCTKRKALEMLLLFDKVRLVGAHPHVDYSPLVATGFVEVESFVSDQRLVCLSSEDESTNAYAAFLKPIILGHALKHVLLSLETQDHLKALGVHPLEAISELYNLRFGQPCDYKIIDLVLEAYRKRKAQIQAQHVQEELGALQAEILEAEAIVLRASPEVLLKLQIQQLGSFVEQLMVYLDLSSSCNGALIQREFDFARVPRSEITTEMPDASNLPDAFTIVGAQLGKLVGNLPRLDSIEQVFRLKETRRREIKTLRGVVSEVESSLRTGKFCAAQRAANLIAKAVVDLRRGQRAGVASKWCTYLSIPVGAAEAAYSLPPVAGMSVAVIGAVNTFLCERNVARNNWLNLGL